MRSAFILTLMAATAVTPVATAAAQDRGRDRSPRLERSQSRAEHPQRVERQQRFESRQQVERPQRFESRQQAERPQRFDRPPVMRAERVTRDSAPRGSFQQRVERRDDRAGVRVQRDTDRRVAYQQRGDRSGSYDRSRNYDRNRSYDRGSYDRNRTYDRGSYNRGDGNRTRWSDSRGRSWNHGWRNDRRYDWRGYRDSNRHLYHLGRYYSPYRNHHYSRFSVGLFLGSAFYGSNYWISDPWYYRLPPAYPGTRWIRYYDDVILVDVYTGEVLDVIYDFFW